VLRSCEAAVKPQLQKFLTTLILSPISSNSDLHQHCYALIYQVTNKPAYPAPACTCGKCWFCHCSVPTVCQNIILCILTAAVLHIAS
jgi:hypothetical protein